MKILQATPGYPPLIGGVENSVHEVVKRLRALGHEVIVVTSDEPPVGSEITNHIYRVPVLLKMKGEWGDIPFCPTIFELLRKLDIDIAHTYTPRKFFAESLAIFRMLSRKKFPFIVSVRLINKSLPPFLCAISDVYRKSVERLMFKSAKKVVVQTEANKDILMKECGVRANKIEIIPNGVDTEMFNPSFVNGEHFRQKCRINEEKVVLFVGRLTSQKGLEYLMEAMPLVTREIPNVKLVIAGEGPLKNFLTELCRKLKISSNVIFLGSLLHDDMPRLFAISDVFVLPSLSESFPNALLEAMAMKKAVVVTKVGVAPEILKNRDTGVLIEPGKSDELAREIVQILSNDDLAKHIGKKARKLVQVKFSWDRVVEQTLMLYEKVLSN
jgi:glycosyltransferase involved in cell wall biosynthesis